jgi:NAD(P)-dependent dehydrogenase (short-subunit alcohol dehydrogenase family)
MTAEPASRTLAALRRAVTGIAGGPSILCRLPDAARFTLVPEVAGLDPGTGSGVLFSPDVGVCAFGRTPAQAVRVAQAYRAVGQESSSADDFRCALAVARQALSPEGVFAGEIALVTGAASGIGRACAESFLRRGAAVVGLDINPAVRQVFDPPAYLGIVCDVTDESAVAAAIESTAANFGGIDMLVLNAGVFPAGCNIADLPLEGWQRVMRINLDGNLIVMKACYPLLKQAARYGRVAVNGSRNVTAPGPGAAAYSCSKAALTQLARVAALEWGKDGIRVNIFHAHAVFDTGIWTEDVLQARAAHYGMTVEQYRSNNILRTEIRSQDVGELAAEMCGPLFSKSTGAQIAIDGGSDRVI